MTNQADLQGGRRERNEAIGVECAWPQCPLRLANDQDLLTARARRARLSYARRAGAALLLFATLTLGAWGFTDTGQEMVRTLLVEHTLAR